VYQRRGDHRIFQAEPNRPIFSDQPQPRSEISLSLDKNEGEGRFTKAPPPFLFPLLPENVTKKTQIICKKCKKGVDKAGWL